MAFSSMHYDVIVVGAGPAGSTAARESALRGLSVLMLDKAEFPRDKPCGGSVTVRCASLLDFDLTPVVEGTITDAKFTWRGKLECSRSSSGVITYMTQRRHLDTFLAERAVDAGVAFRQRENITSVDCGGDHVTVRAGGHTYRGRALVAADGANGVAAKMAGIQTNFLHGIALEGNITPKGEFPSTWETTMGIDFGGLPGGYGWVFPKGDHLNIGLGGWKHVGPRLRRELGRLVESYGFDPTDLWGVRGHYLPIRHSDSKLVDGNVLLVGDAAGVLDPLTGEGIYGALWTGKAAAANIRDYLDGKTCGLDGYREQVERQLLPDLNVSRRLHDIFHMWPSLFLGIERGTSTLWPAIERLLQGESHYLAVARDLGRIWPLVEILSDFIRTTPALHRMSGLPDTAQPERFFRREGGHRTAAHRP